jgi:hypothetical protein
MFEKVLQLEYPFSKIQMITRTAMVSCNTHLIFVTVNPLEKQANKK